MPPRSGRIRILFLLVGLSGAAGLMDEVVFTRRLVQIVGSTSDAVATVLAAFMTGFALGAYVWGRRADSVRRPLHLYAGLEVAIALSAIGTMAVLPRLHPVFERVYLLSERNATVAVASRFLVLFILLCIPTTCMGATLPVLARALHARDAGSGRTIGLIYAVNTAGAVAGTLASGFALVELLGLTRTVAVASALNVAAAASVLVLVRGASTEPDPGDAPSEARREPMARDDGSLRRAALLATFVSGLCALGFEVVWTRILIFYITGTTYAFSTMLATFLVGITVGSLLFARRADIEPRPRLVLALCQGTAGLLALLVIRVLSGFVQGREYPRPGAPYVVRLLEALLHGRLRPAPGGPHWLDIQLQQLGESFAVMLLPALCLGGAFPIVCRLVAGRRRVGRDVGVAYATNTCGAIIGSVLAGFGLIPLLGLEGANAALGGLLLLSSAALLWQERHALPAAARFSYLLPPAAMVLYLVVLPRRSVILDLAEGERLVFYDEGRTATVAVVENGTGERRLLIDNIFVAGSHSVMLTDQKSLAHFPCLLHPRPRRVLTVGFGSGGASHSFSLYREVERVDAVEIVPAVIEAAAYFPSVNRGVLSSPKLHVILDDARSYLSLSPAATDSYDVISSDCTDLSYRANADLYQQEFFEACRAHLNPGGIMCVWLPLRHLSRWDFACALQSFRASFPHGTVWYMLNMPTHFVLLLGQDRPLQVDARRIEERLARPEIRQDLQEIGLTRTSRIAGCLLLSERALATFIAGAPHHSEDRPRLEFTVPRYDRGVEREFENLEEMLPLREPLRRVLPDVARVHPAFIEVEDGVAQALLQGHIEVLRFRADLLGNERYALALKGDPTAVDVRRLLTTGRRRNQKYLPTLSVDVSRLLDRGNLELLDGRDAEALGSYLEAARAGVEPSDAWIGAAVAARRSGAGDGCDAVSLALAACPPGGPERSIAQGLADLWRAEAR